MAKGIWQRQHHDALQRQVDTHEQKIMEIHERMDQMADMLRTLVTNQT